MRIALELPKSAVAKLLEVCKKEPQEVKRQESDIQREDGTKKDGSSKKEVKNEDTKNEANDDNNNVGPLGLMGIKELRIHTLPKNHVVTPRVPRPSPVVVTPPTPTPSCSLRSIEGSMETSPLLINLLRSKQHQVDACRRQVNSHEEEKSLKLKLRLPLEKKASHTNSSQSGSRGLQAVDEPPKKLPKLILSMKERTVKLKEKGAANNLDVNHRSSHYKSSYDGFKPEIERYGEAGTSSGSSVTNAVRTLKLPPGISLNEVHSSSSSSSSSHRGLNVSIVGDNKESSSSSSLTSSLLSKTSKSLSSSTSTTAKLVSLSSEGSARLIKVPSGESRRSDSNTEKRDKIEVILLGSKKDDSNSSNTPSKSNKVEDLADRLVRGVLKRKLSATATATSTNSSSSVVKAESTRNNKDDGTDNKREGEQGNKISTTLKDTSPNDIKSHPQD